VGCSAPAIVHIFSNREFLSSSTRHTIDAIWNKLRPATNAAAESDLSGYSALAQAVATHSCQ
jgi:hypothetical protein